jgi:carbamoylphosphate synthase large subunit
MKRACFLNNLSTAKYSFVYNIKQDFEKLNELSFPMIVKHYQSAGSWSITKDSKVTNKEDLYVQVKRMLDLHHGALVE